MTEPQEPRSPAQTPAEAVYDDVILSYFASAEKGEMEPVPRQLALDAAIALVAPTVGYPQLGVASALLVLMTAERDHLLELFARETTSSLYTVMVNDRHKDPEAVVFTTKEAALAYAREAAKDMNLVEDHIDEWLYYASHKSEDDSVWVVETELNQGESS